MAPAQQPGVGLTDSIVMFVFPDVRYATHFPMPEGTNLEFKEGFATPMDKIFATICGILNAGGGYMVFGVRDRDHAITGIRPRGKEYDRFLLNIDTIYHGHTVRTVDAPGDAIPLGTVTTCLVTAAEDIQMLVITMRPENGKFYETADGVRWHRLSASNYRERVPQGVYTKKDVDDAVRNQRTVLERYRQDYSAVLGAAKQYLDKCNSLEKEVAELRDLLFKEILERKRAAEDVRTVQSCWWWPFQC
jgi:predicted HTH transcriptional regulator